MAHDVFISHSTKDKAVSDAVCAALENAGIRCWIAPRDVRPGRSFAGEITRGIQQSKAMVLIFSTHSNNSEQVLREVQLAVTAHLHILQFRIEEVVLNDDLQYFLGTPHWLDALTPPLEKHIGRLKSSVKELLEAPAEESSKGTVTSARQPQQPSPKAHAVAEVRVRRSKKKAFVVAAAAAVILASAAWYFVKFPEKVLTTVPPTQKEKSSTESHPADGAINGKYGPVLLKIGNYEIVNNQLVAKMCGFIDLAGKVVIQPQWDDSLFFQEGFAAVERSGKWGFIDTTGRVVIEPKWDRTWVFAEGLAVVKQNNKYGFIDKTGRVVIQPEWDEAIPFYGEVASVTRNGKEGIIDKTGRIIIEPRWEYVRGFTEGLAHAKSNGKYGFIDKTGRVVIEPQWQDASGFSEGVASVSQHDQHGFIDKTGRVVIELQWDSADSFQEDLAAVRRRDKYGFIDKEGRVAIGLQWDYAAYFSEGLAQVHSGRKCGFIDKTGRVVIEPQWEDAYSFYRGLAQVQRAGKWGLIDKTGHIVLDLQWDRIEAYYEGGDGRAYWLVGRQEGNKTIAAWFDSKGKQIWSSDQASPPATVKPLDTSSNAIAAASKEQPYVNSLGMKFVPVPGTGMLFSIWETRVKDYKVFAEAKKREWPKPDFQQTEEHPAVNVSWEDATAFCEWLTEQERTAGRISARQSYRLPSDEEWSAAVGLEKEVGSTPKERSSKVKDVYPWGTKWPPPKGAGNYDPSLKVDDYKETSPVGSFEANRHGLYDMGGNVWQWCEDWWNAEKKYRVLRGASWYVVNPDYLLSSYRIYNAPEYRNDNFGFRCVLVVESSR